jgi:hypothetical protein
MGYHTDFRGSFRLDKQLSPEIKEYLTKLANTRRMGRKTDDEFGIEGEFFTDGTGFKGQDSGGNVINGNEPPVTQPSLWCQWIPTGDGLEIEWDGGEKFYNYTEWIYYIINKILKPNGYTLNGSVRWRGEEFDDDGVMEVRDNVLFENGMEFTNPVKTKYDFSGGFGNAKTIEKKDYMRLDVVLDLEKINALKEV